MIDFVSRGDGGHFLRRQAKSELDRLVKESGQWTEYKAFESAVVGHARVQEQFQRMSEFAPEGEMLTNGTSLHERVEEVQRTANLLQQRVSRMGLSEDTSQALMDALSSKAERAAAGVEAVRR